MGRIQRRVMRSELGSRWRSRRRGRNGGIRMIKNNKKKKQQQENARTSRTDTNLVFKLSPFHKSILIHIHNVKLIQVRSFLQNVLPYSVKTKKKSITGTDNAGSSIRHFLF